MEETTVYVHPDNKSVKAYRYAPTVILVQASTVNNTNESIVTDIDGFRYKRSICAKYSKSYFNEYYKI